MRSALVALVLFVVLGAACGGNPPVPRRGVVEADLGSWKFRRFQGPLLDVEVWIDGNKGEAFSASYITNDAEKRGRIEDKDLVNVTVTKYEKADGVVRETVKLVRRLAQEKGYQVEEAKIEGVRALTITGPAEAWVMWPSTKYVVKVGGQGRTSVPKGMVESYGERFPSKLPGGSLEGPLPPGPQAKPKKGDAVEENYDPANPKANLDNYDPDKVKIPERKIEPDVDPAGTSDKKKKPKK
ncbi:MAG: hypothetical protein H0T42_29655 [Deltaproteobacteria bacterium]|nr:hypothetical protein [Deltaproteobacteria bacterium]